jgi:transcriptional regulator with XRE-family HTH domain
MPRDMETHDPSATIVRLREAVRTVAENTSLRKVAREIGMSASGLKKFLEGAAPYSPTLRRLHRWYVQHSGVQRGHVEFAEADAALRVLLHDLTPDARRITADRMAECLRLGYAESGRAAPGWIAELAPDPQPDPRSSEEQS